MKTKVFLYDRLLLSYQPVIKINTDIGKDLENQNLLFVVTWNLRENNNYIKIKDD